MCGVEGINLIVLEHEDNVIPLFYSLWRSKKKPDYIFWFKKKWTIYIVELKYYQYNWNLKIFETSSHIDENMTWNIRVFKLLNLRVKGYVCSIPFFHTIIWLFYLQFDMLFWSDKIDVLSESKYLRNILNFGLKMSNSTNNSHRHISRKIRYMCAVLTDQRG